jgi:uncharacterized protein DUF1259
MSAPAVALSEGPGQHSKFEGSPMHNMHRLALVSLIAAVVAVAIGAGPALAGKSKPRSSLPTKALDGAMQSQGQMSNGVLSFSVDRTDITNVHIHGVPIKPAFEINGSINFQSLGHGRAFMNGDLALKPSELNAAISAIIRNHLVFQAEHQHMYDFSPMVWFVHLRGRGDAVTLAHEVHNVVAATGTPKQSSPSNPKTPLDKNRLEKILHGYDASVSEDGVVTVFVARRNPIRIDGVTINPANNIATNVAFEPLNKSGTEVAAIPDFAMEAGEINSVVGTMQAQGWDIGCLYNQETAERPQLYFSHEFKTGNPYTLAQEVRAGLDRTNAR